MEWTIEQAPDGVDPAHALLTGLVARVHSVPAEAVRIEATVRGRRARAGAAPVAVSLSRTAGWVAAACSGPGEPGSVGIDAEAWAPFRDSGTRAGSFADVVLAAEERIWFRAAAGGSEADRLAALLRTWVRKEAVLKALGTGFDTARGGLDPAAIVLGPPWDPPTCTSHPEVELADHLAGGDDPVLVSTAHRASGQASRQAD
ncbi:4'-phosphopantetheinyl transferase superfamily protein [Nocardia zapadnayensis]|uniref:4'-phosphopantetheinyl transferase family protein n=1 Tax=Brevibacterium sp. R8603A2 TaxID=2929779 RepID=UPI001FF898B9|nr:4'-phosphopantetheinyl transferase superfamily protein [Nocardia zapadnayensis]MCK1804005.1 4'-phosphopantetheinyl transferase superfamily protein [Brevibacterium sp. R8603A2]MCX0276581.1 4'-phosphopantetheinyl transferase superfamily protein [Nocardia zapadnayensis]